MSRAIRTYIRSVLLETTLYESVPREPSDLDEAPPRAPSRGGGQAASPSSTPRPGSTTPPAPPRPPDPLDAYLQAAVGWLSENDVEIGAAADYVVEQISGTSDPEAVMALYESAAAVDIAHGQHDELGNAKNWTVLLLGTVLATCTGQSIINYLPTVLTEAESLIIKAQEAASPTGLEERRVRRYRHLLNEGSTSVGRYLRVSLGSTIDKITSNTIKSAFDDEIRTAAKSAADGIQELDSIVAGRGAPGLGGRALADFVRDEASLAIRRTVLSDINQPWAVAARGDLITAGIPDPKIGDLLNPPRGVSLSPDSQVAKDVLGRELRTSIEGRTDADIYAVAGEPRVRAEVKAKSAKPGSPADVGVELVGTVGSELAIPAIKYIVGAIFGGAVATAIGVYAASSLFDVMVDTQVNQDVLQALRTIANAPGILPDERITALDAYLTIVHNKTNGFSTIRSRLNSVCDEYWVPDELRPGTPSQDCVDFRKILSCGPHNVAGQ